MDDEVKKKHASDRPPLHCPDCPAVYYYAAPLGAHRRREHGVLGTSTAALSNRKRKETTHASSPEKKAPRTAEAKLLIKHTQKNVEPHSHDIPEATLAVAFGRFQEFQRSFAYEYDIPPRTFAKRLGELIYASAVRE